MYSPRTTDGNFIYNSMLASALIQLLPAQERKIVRSWIDKLHNVDNDEQIPLRNEYMWFLLLIIKNRQIVPPFNAMPFETDLVSLREIIPREVYRAAVTRDAGEASIAWIENIMSKGTGELEGPPRDKSIPPSKYLQNQPIPQRGVFCYMGAFSDQDK